MTAAPHAADASPSSAAPNSPRQHDRHDVPPSSLPQNEKAVDGDTNADIKSEPVVPDLEPVDQKAADFPDGGLQAWIVVFGAFCATFVSFGVINAFGVFNAYYMQTLPDASSGAIAMIGALQLWGLFFVGMLVGKPFDRGYLRPIYFAGSVLFTFCWFASSWGTELWHFLLAQGLGVGLAMGCLFTPALSCVGHWFKARRSTALGISSAGSSIGGIILPIQLRRMISTTGFPWAVRTSGFILVFMLILSNLTLRTRLAPKHDGRIIDFRVYRDLTFSWWAASNFFSFLGIYTPLFFLANFALFNGVDSDLSYYSVAIAAAGSTFGRLLPMYLADKIGLLNVLVPCTLICCPLIFIWLACTGAPSTIVFAVLYGFFSGAFVSGNPAGTATITSDMRDIGTRNGMVFFTCSWAALAGSPIAGAIVAKSYAGAAGFSGGCVLIGVACQIVTRHLHVRNTGRRRT